MLRWAEAEPVTDEPWWWEWINALARWFRGLFGWVAESGRYVVWVLGAVLAALLVTYVVRLVRVRGLPRVPKPFVPPSHVRDLDIRPESLPDDVGSAALALWEQRRAARGARAAVSRVVVAARARARRADPRVVDGGRMPQRSRGRGSLRRMRTTQRDSSRRGARPSTAGYCPRPGPCKHCAASSPSPLDRSTGAAMRRPSGLTVVVFSVLALVVVWVASNTEWGEVDVADAAARRRRDQPVLCGAEARRDARRDERAAAVARRPSTAAVVVLSTWGWDIDDARRAELERWVEAGGRLVVDAALDQRHRCLRAVERHRARARGPRRPRGARPVRSAGDRRTVSDLQRDRRRARRRRADDRRLLRRLQLRLLELARDESRHRLALGREGDIAGRARARRARAP